MIKEDMTGVELSGELPMLYAELTVTMAGLMAADPHGRKVSKLMILHALKQAESLDGKGQGVRIEMPFDLADLMNRPFDDGKKKKSSRMADEIETCKWLVQDAKEAHGNDDISMMNAYLSKLEDKLDKLMKEVKDGKAE